SIAWCPVRMIWPTTASTWAGVAPVMIPAGVPHMPRITWANRRAATWSRISTGESPGMAPHRLVMAASWPAPVRWNAGAGPGGEGRGGAALLRPDPEGGPPGRHRQRGHEAGDGGRNRHHPRAPFPGPHRQQGTDPDRRHDQAGEQDRNEPPARPRL